MSNETDVIREALEGLVNKLALCRRSWGYVIGDTMTVDNMLEGALQALAAHDANASPKLTALVEAAGALFDIEGLVHMDAETSLIEVCKADALHFIEALKAALSALAALKDTSTQQAGEGEGGAVGEGLLVLPPGCWANRDGWLSLPGGAVIGQIYPGHEEEIKTALNPSPPIQGVGREITELDARREQMRRIFIRDRVDVPQEQAWAVHRATDDELAAIIAASSPSAVAAPAGWRDISEHDGTDAPVLVAVGEAVGEAHFDSEHGWHWAGYHWTDAADGSVIPDHFQPLPASPGAASPPLPASGEGVDLEGLKAQLAEQTEIVARIWRQLGSPTYAELAGRDIYDLIDELKARALSQPDPSKGGGNG